MDLKLKNKLYVVTGATSGFGKAIALRLLEEGATVIINARGEEKLAAMAKKHPQNLETINGDITTDAVISRLKMQIGERPLSGLVINAGGPPAKSFMDTDITDWDDAYKSVLRWKVKLTQELLPTLGSDRHGRIVYIESVSVKQPIENLVLSNSLRLSVVGFVKTLSQEVAHQGITLNIIAPGYHATPAMDRLFVKKSKITGESIDEARTNFVSEVPVGRMGDADDLASLAAWLLSPWSGYVTGQTISVDGGLAQGVFS